MTTYNFIGLVNDVANRLNEVELLESNFSGAVGFYSAAKGAVNASIRSINQQQFEWPFNHNTIRKTLIPGSVRYLIPRDAKTVDMDYFRVVKDTTLGNPTVKLKLISYNDYLEKYLDYEYNKDTSVRALPKFVFRSPSSEYGIIPPPDKAYTIEYEYYRTPVDLNLFSDVPTIPEDFRYVIIDGAMVHAHTFRGDNESSQLSQRQFEAGMKAMRTLYINRYDYVSSTVRS